MTVTGAAGAGASTQVLFRDFDSTGGAVFFYDSPITIAASDSFRVQIICETTT
jgi:ABC-type transport system involved in Fe-S cluster assembly fused permease/ATPase subunit